MTIRRRALVAAQPAAWKLVRAMLDEVIDLVPAYTTAEAFRALASDAPTIDLIISTIAFDDSQMLDFLQTVKSHPTLNHIPFLCSRVLPSVLPDHLVPAMRLVAKESGATDLVDVAMLPPEAARSVFRAAVASCV